VSGSEDDVLGFISASFPSVWALEVLLVLKSERRIWTRDELVTSLRASELVVSKALEALMAGGLGSVGDEGAIYLPVSPEVDACVEQVEQLYRSRPNAVRRAIISVTTSSASAFADAFKLRDQKHD
jgi:hypothetical protein